MAVELLIAGWFVSVCLSKLADLGLKYGTHWLSQRDVMTNERKLKDLLQKVIGAVNIAGRKEEDISEVQGWVQQLKQAISDAENVLDCMEYDLLRERSMELSMISSKILERSSEPASRRILGHIGDIFNSKGWQQNDTKDLSAVVAKLSDIVATMPAFLKAVTAPSMSTKLSTIDDLAQAPEWRLTSPYQIRPKMIGRKAELDALIGQLQIHGPGSGNNTFPFSVISVVGMAGTGKTTLVREAYFDKERTEFDLKVWICVTHVFSIKRILMDAVVGTAEGLEDRYNNISKLQETLTERLKNNKFLIVLDDIWHSPRAIMDNLWGTFRLGKEGSKVVITTRDHKIATIMSGGKPPIHLLSLSFEDYRSMFEHCAFGKSMSSNHLELLPAVKDLAKRFGFLPLAAEAYGQELHPHDQNQMREMPMRNLSSLPSVLQSLKLSYDLLPTHLKPCFIYSSLFPKGLTFQKMKLIRMWMALGFLGIDEKERKMEDKGRDYFDQLVNKSIFIKVDESKDSYALSGALHELAEYLSSGEYFRADSERVDGSQPVCIPQSVRHVYLHINNLRRSSESLSKVPNLHTLVICGTTQDPEIHHILHDTMKNMRRLRVLLLEYIIPDALDHMQHLRYLEIQVKSLQCSAQLPQSLCKLYHLQTLVADYGSANQLYMPEDLCRLISLRFIETVPETIHTVSNIGSMTSLQELQKFQVWKQEGFDIRQLESLNQIRGTLCIYGLENVASEQDAAAAKLQEKKHLSKVELCWALSSKDKPEENEITVHEDVLQGLAPHQDLDVLKISGYIGKRTPRWLQHPDTLHLKRLVLSNCHGLTKLPPFGHFPYLKVLHLRHMRSIEQIGTELYGADESKAFPQLEELVFKDLCNWRMWCKAGEGIRLFPSLHRLYIIGCGMLKGPLALPNQLEEIKVFLSTGDDESYKKSASQGKDSSSTSLVICTEHRWLLSELVAENSRSSLRKLELHGYGILEDFIEGQDSWLASLTSLQHLQFINCSVLRSLPLTVAQLSSLETLTVENCTSLQSLPSNITELKSLKTLQIVSCQNLTEESVRKLSFQHRPEILIDGEHLCQWFDTLSRISSIRKKVKSSSSSSSSIVDNKDHQQTKGNHWTDPATAYLRNVSKVTKILKAWK